jgi:hypothetical protein
MIDTRVGLTYTIEVHEGTWFQLWWNGQECIYSEDLEATTHEDAEKEAEAIASGSSPLSRVMQAMGCVPTEPEARTCR